MTKSALHKVIPVYNGNLTVNFGPYSELDHVKNSNFHIHSFIFLIIDSEGDAVVVDTGFCENHLFGIDSVCSRPEDAKIVRSLALHGYDAAMIKNVIMTHIHWDHTGGMKHFTNAQFHVQINDFTALMAMDANDETGYCPDHWLNVLPKVNLLDGDYELKPGIKLKYTGWHSPGHQIVEVDTLEGKVILAGDETIDHKSFWQMMPDEFWLSMNERHPGKFYWVDKHLDQVETWLAGRTGKIIPSKIKPKYSDIFKLGKHPLFSHDVNLLKIKSIPS